MASRRADPLRYTRRRSPDTLALVVAAVLACLLCQAGWSAAFGDGLPQLDVGPHRRLLNDFTPLQKFGAFWYFLGVLYILLGMSIVCEDYFVASLAALGLKFGLSDDVNGATLMAAGSSLPEVFSSFMALANSDTDNSLGMATIVGSSVYNILVIIGWSAIAGKDILLDWKPLVRDSCFYFITIIFLLSTFSTGDIYFGDGLVAVLLYSCYVGFMTQNQKVFKKMDLLAEKYVPYLHRKTTERLARKGIAAGGGLVESDTELLPLAANDAAAEAGAAAAAAEAGSAPEGAPAAGHAQKDEHDGHEADHLVWPSDGTLGDKVKFCIKAPYFALLKFTIPDCRTERWKKFYVLTFFCSVIWIGILAWFLVAWASHVACVLKIPDIIVGLTVLAAGTSLPDTLSSVIVARQGLGDMAVANAIGSNVFNVLFGLGFPWCLWILISGEKIVVPITGLRENAFTMLIVGFFYMTVFTLRGFHMTAKLGYCFIAVYFAYVLMVCVRFGIISRPPESTTCV